MGTYKINRATACKSIEDREPRICSTFHQRNNRVYCFTDIRDCVGKTVSFIWINRKHFWIEHVSEDYVRFPRYRTWSYKNNQTYPGSWAVAIVLDNKIYDMVGFQWI